jgi:isoprenylcysteine carboxyl methyltransferase (ICMT) family protein YpbQ
VIEIALLPWLLGAAVLVLPFTIANALLLAWRIRIEAEVLAERRGE